MSTLTVMMIAADRALPAAKPIWLGLDCWRGWLVSNARNSIGYYCPQWTCVARAAEWRIDRCAIDRPWSALIHDAGSEQTAAARASQYREPRVVNLGVGRQRFAVAAATLQFFLEDRYQHGDRDRDPYLAFHGVLRRAVETFDPQVLLYPFEKEFDFPSALVQGTDGQWRKQVMIGQERQVPCRDRDIECGASDSGSAAAPRISSSVCCLIAALVERNGAHGNTDRHRSIVVVERQPQQIDVDMVELRGEPLLNASLPLSRVTAHDSGPL